MIILAIVLFFFIVGPISVFVSHETGQWWSGPTMFMALFFLMLGLAANTPTFN